MSQSATFYRIDPNVFSSLEKNSQFDWYAHRKGYTTLAGTHEGLRYLFKRKPCLVKDEFVDQIFYPASYLEEGKPELEDSPSEEAIFYHTPATVLKISDFLKSWAEKDIAAIFNPTELNSNSIYPMVWHNNESSQYAYNLKGLLTEFSSLKAFFSAAVKEQQYVLIFIG